MVKAEIDLVICEILETQVKIFLLVKVVILVLQSLDDFCDVITAEEVLILPGSFKKMSVSTPDQFKVDRLTIYVVLMRV